MQVTASIAAVKPKTAMPRQRICIVATVATPLRLFMRPHIKALSRSYDIVLVCNGTPTELDVLLDDQVSFVACPIQRNISLGKDLYCLFWLRRFLRNGNFTAVHTVMPKSGLLGMLAAKFAGVKHRFHSFTGQVWATRKGTMRRILKTMDKVLAASATRLLADGPLQLEFLVAEGIVDRRRIGVVADGSLSGVDIPKFRRDDLVRRNLRSQLGINDGDVAFLFVGRLTREKGVVELLKAFDFLAARYRQAHLLLVGPSEGDFEEAVANAQHRADGRLHRIGFSPRPQDYMSAADVFCLPSYREGFNNSIIEAAVAGLPAIASDIYGIADAVEHGKTGLLHEVKNIDAMVSLMMRMMEDPSTRIALGNAAYHRAVTLFPEERIVRGLLEFYRSEGIFVECDQLKSSTA